MGVTKTTLNNTSIKCLTPGILYGQIVTWGALSITCPITSGNLNDTCTEKQGVLGCPQYYLLNHQWWFEC